MVAAALLAVLVLGGGCAKKSCAKLVAIACDHVAERDDGDEQCERLKKRSDAVTDEECKEILQLLKDSGKIQTTER